MHLRNILFKTLSCAKQIQKVHSYSSWGSKKTNRKIKLYPTIREMADPQIEATLAPLREEVREKGSIVRKLKECGAAEFDIKKAVAELKASKKKLEDMELSLVPQAASFDRAKMEDLLKRRFFYDQSFALYGGISGQYDFGPMGCALKSNILQLWRQFFVIENQMLEVDCSILTPEPVLKASGHMDRFADLMVKDLKTGECFRLDHLIKHQLEKLVTDKKNPISKEECEDIVIKLDGMTKDEMGTILRKYNMKSPNTGNDLSDPVEFNLMFGTQIGPTGLVRGFLRPETAQGIFVNFKRLLEFNQGRLPFAVAQIGNAFRNEISPRSGLIRVREFTMAEIEHFCDPNDKAHPKFKDAKDTKMILYSACNQMDGKSAVELTIGEAVESGLVANETLGFFMAKIHAFLLLVGIEPKRLRFRQHMNNEMAHYACDCWDAECLTSYGWIECVGCADRSAYDLTQHTNATGVKLVAEKTLPSPKTVQLKEIIPNKQILGKTFKKDSKQILDALAKLSLDETATLEKNLNESGSFDLNLEEKKIQLTTEMLSIKDTSKVVYVEEITPSVVEPSFGIGRIMYSLLEHRFNVREDDEQRCFFSLPAVVAPIKCSVLPLTNNPVLEPFVKTLSNDLTKLSISYKIDDASGSIGRRYARTDEIAIPYAITVDFATQESPHTVTLRERDSLGQVRIPVEDVASVVKDLSNRQLSWLEIQQKYPKFEVQDSK